MLTVSVRETKGILFKLQVLSPFRIKEGTQQGPLFQHTVAQSKYNRPIKVSMQTDLNQLV